MLIGYARVSTPEQNLDLQTDALNRAGCEKLFTDKAGGARAERPGLEQALAHLRKGDISPNSSVSPRDASPSTATGPRPGPVTSRRSWPIWAFARPGPAT